MSNQQKTLWFFISEVMALALWSCTQSDVPANPGSSSPTPSQDASTAPDASPLPDAPPPTPDAAPGALFLNGFFPIGAFVVPEEDMDKWVGRGVNTLVSVAIDNGNDADVTAWDDAAARRGLRTIRRPLSNPDADRSNTHLLAWSHRDEPDMNGLGSTFIAINQGNYAAWKQSDPKRPAFVNFGIDVLGAEPGNVRPPWCTMRDGNNCNTEEDYRQLIAAADWVSNDIYPVTGYLNDEHRRFDLTLIADQIEKLRAYSNKPQFCFVETSNQEMFAGSRGVTPAELRAEIWIAIVHGVRGFSYFSPRPDPFAWDMTPADVAAELTKQNAVVTKLAPVLQSEINPAGVFASVAAPLRVAWRIVPSGVYIIVVNTGGTRILDAAVNVSGAAVTTATAIVYDESRSVPLLSGRLIDTFGPFSRHIYVLGH